MRDDVALGLAVEAGYQKPCLHSVWEIKQALSLY